MKTCSRCLTGKPLTEFSRRSKSADGLQSRCKSCQADTHTAYYQQHPEKWEQYQKDKREKNRGWLNARKDSPCVDCGGSFPPCVMDFDHREGEVKEGNLSTMVTSRARDVVERELEKCDLVCANCHRLRTCSRTGHLHKK